MTDDERNKQLTSETKLEAQLKGRLAIAYDEIRSLMGLINELNCQINDLTKGKGYDEYMGSDC